MTTSIEDQLTAIALAACNLCVIDFTPAHITDLVMNPDKQIKEFIVSPEKVRTSAFPRNSQGLLAQKPDAYTTRKRQMNAQTIIESDEGKALLKLIKDFKKDCPNWLDYLDRIQISRENRNHYTVVCP